MITFDEFKKMELIVARVTAVRDHPKADKLLILEVEIGKGTADSSTDPSSQEGKKEIVAGIKGFYAKDELIGKNIVLVNNLEPAVIRGEESNGMLLAASSGDDLAILVPEKDIPSGAEIK